MKDQSDKNIDLISVIIPTFNEEKRIERCINSMRNQTYKNLEIIVVDDWSTDNTSEVVEKIAKEDKRVKYHLLPFKPPRRKNWRGYDINAGFGARNYGFKIANGEWLTTQDADDASLLNRIEVQHDLAQQYGASLITISWLKLRGEILQSTLDIDSVIKDVDHEKLIISPDKISSMARENRGVLMIEPLHKFIPFPIKWFPLTRKLFYKRNDPYPGADNCMLFHKSIRDAGYYFRHRNERTWGTPSGRGTGRDFAYRVALDFNNSWSFYFPLYLWDVSIENPDIELFNRYIHQ